MKDKLSVSVVFMVFRYEVLVVSYVYKFSYLQIQKRKAHLLHFRTVCGVYRTSFSKTIFL